MTVETRVSQALERARAERETVERKRDAVEEFADRVDGVAPRTRPAADNFAASGATLTARSPGTDGCQAVRDAFDATVGPHGTVDVADGGTTLDRLAAEFNEEVACALSPATTGMPFTASLKRAVLAAADARRDELGALSAALDREEASLVAARTDLDGVVTWLSRADETRLVELDFDALAARHDRLDEFEARCEAVATDRQEFLDGATNVGATIGVENRSVVESLYDDFRVDYPVLATTARLADLCRSCRRAVRDHLTRRV